MVEAVVVYVPELPVYVRPRVAAIVLALDGLLLVLLWTHREAWRALAERVPFVSATVIASGVGRSTSHGS